MAGDTPSLYRLGTEAEAQAFQKGAEDTVGWLDYHIVPDESFTPYSDVDEAIRELEKEAGATLKNHVELNTDSLPDPSGKASSFRWGMKARVAFYVGF